MVVSDGCGLFQICVNFWKRTNYKLCSVWFWEPIDVDWTNMKLNVWYQISWGLAKNFSHKVLSPSNNFKSFFQTINSHSTFLNLLEMMICVGLMQIHIFKFPIPFFAKKIVYHLNSNRHHFICWTTFSLHQKCSNIWFK